MKIASKNDWKTEALPANPTLMHLNMTLTPEEMSKAVFGFIPLEMEDKWFIYLETDYLYVHRSWTGHCIYKVKIEFSDPNYLFSEVLVNTDTSQYLGSTPEEDLKTLSFLIQYFLLTREVPFPKPENMNAEELALYRHHLIGYGRNNSDK